MKWCVTPIICKMKWVAGWQWLRKVKSLHSPVCSYYGVTTAHVNIWNTFNCCKQRCSLDTGSCYWEAVLTVPEGILGLKPLQMRVRKEIKTLLVCGSVASTLLQAHQGLWLTKYVMKPQDEAVKASKVCLAWLGLVPQATGRRRSFHMGRNNGDIFLSEKFKTLHLQMHAIQIVNIKYIECNPLSTQAEKRATFWLIQIIAIFTR